MSSSNRLIVSILAVAVVAIGFWMLLLGPKREEADKLSIEVDGARVALAESQSKAAEATAAQREFPTDYQQLVVLGKAVPASDDTSSLLVELNRIGRRSHVKFESIQLAAEGEGAAVPAPVTTTPAAPAAPAGAVPAAASVPPTEATASLLPLGATIGAAGLAVMPYDLTFSGDFSHVADFIDGIDSLIHTGGRDIAVDGRLVTLNGFALNADPEAGFPHLTATFSVTTYLTPPSQGVTAGATPTEPVPAIATPAATEPATGESTETTGATEPAEASTTNVSTPR
jgi:Tfp pilus assembly protein PilO